MPAICSVVMPFRAAFSLSVTKMSFRCAASRTSIDVDDARLGGQAGPHGVGGQQQVLVPMVRLAVDLGHDAGDHRRAGRRLDELHARLVPVGDRLQVVAHPQADGVALQPPVLLARQIDPHLGHVVALAEIVVPHQPVEIHRRGQPDVAGVVGDLGHAGQVRLELAHGGVGAFQRRALVEVEHQQQFVLVVERQHLQRHAAHGRQAHRRRRSAAP